MPRVRVPPRIPRKPVRNSYKIPQVPQSLYLVSDSWRAEQLRLWNTLEPLWPGLNDRFSTHYLHDLRVLFSICALASLLEGKDDVNAHLMIFVHTFSKYSHSRVYQTLQMQLKKKKKQALFLNSIG